MVGVAVSIHHEYIAARSISLCKTVTHLDRRTFIDIEKKFGMQSKLPGLWYLREIIFIHIIHLLPAIQCKQAIPCLLPSLYCKSPDIKLADI